MAGNLVQPIALRGTLTQAFTRYSLALAGSCDPFATYLSCC